MCGVRQTEPTSPVRTPDNLPPPPTPEQRAALQQALLGWFAREGRDLPWRRTRNPYHILVSEVMLQQTQVDRVIPKYHAFLEAFPTLEALAAAPVADVIRQWSGLGYNRRAVNLQRTARAVLAEHGGTFPQQVEALRKLPGIGPYTAGAVACFAFEQDVAFLDTNIRRVVRRVLVGPADAPPATTEHALHTLATGLVPAGEGWPWNQAIMELGALICTAAAPACWRCPLRDHCRTYATWRTTDEQLFAGWESGTPTYPAAQRSTRRVAERREAPFIGSNRYYRGRIIEQLRALPSGAGTTLLELGPRIKPDFDPPTDLEWLQRLVAGLVRDGLAEQHADAVRLPT
ncbi:MAG: A/G-specific adenine glycosylase [Chloroflexaceae bacterium]|nr:A/G-specific adenine glycosylase [Chloroflexaceae bacterium]